MDLDDVSSNELTSLRVRNRLLSSRLKKAQRGSDENFAALCDVGTAQAALYEIWTAADLSCESDAYDVIVEYVISILSRNADDKGL